MSGRHPRQERMTKLGTRTRCHAVAEALRRSVIS